MTDDQRARLAEFRALFDAIPGKPADRVKEAARLANVKPNTVRTWRMTAPPRVPTHSTLMLMRVSMKAAGLIG